MIYYGTSGVVYDANDTTYPILNPSLGNKMYSETSINNIALVLGKPVKVSEMAEAVATHGGLQATYLQPVRSPYTTTSIT